MRYVLSTIFACSMLFSAVPDASAQERGRTGSQDDGPRVIIGERGGGDTRGRERTGRAERSDRGGRAEREDEDYRYQDRAYGQKTKKGKGPAFCRSGAGHPVHGRSWCAEKGWGVGHDRYDRRYERDASWGDIIFGRTPRRTDDRVMLSSSVLEDVLGRRTLDRFDAYRQDLGLRGALSGRWSEARSGSRVLRLHADGTPVATLYDDDRDGRVDVIRLVQ